MKQLLLFLLTFAVSITGGLIGKKLHLTAPFQVGGIIGVAVFNVFTGIGYSPSWLSIIIQIISGAYIGLGIRKKDLSNVRALIVPASSMLLGMMIINVVMSLIIRALGGMDLMTAMVSCIPGGVTESVIIGDQMGADVPVVAVLQMVRTVFAIILFPPLISRLTRKDRVVKPVDEIKEAKPIEEVEEISKKEIEPWKKTLLTLAIASLGGFIGSFLTFIPVSVLIFSMIAVVAANLLGAPVGLPRSIKRFAQTCTGVYVGCRMTIEFARQMGNLIAPIVFLMLGYLVFNTLLGLLLYKLFRIPKTEALFSCLPAGVSDTALIATDLVNDCTSIAFLQIARLTSCILLFPLMIQFVVSLGI